MSDDGYVPPWDHGMRSDPECERVKVETSAVDAGRFSYGNLMAVKYSDGVVRVLRRPFHE